MSSWRIGNDRIIRFEPTLFLLILLAHLLVLFRFEWYSIVNVARTLMVNKSSALLTEFGLRNETSTFSAH
ncbi:MAG: hypothetical protein M3R08_03170 [Bacteroidota bacterium]|nr:hypothetical protein [Bacteroidota bacterium]